MSTTATVQPIAFARTILFIWKVYPLDSVLSATFSSTPRLYRRKPPIRSVTSGRRTVTTKRLVLCETNLRFRS